MGTSMSVQINHFQSIYGKMAVSQKRQQKQSETLSQKTDSLQDNAYSPAKTGNTLSPYHAFERMKNAGSKSRTYNLKMQAKGTLREVENDRYLIEKSDEIEGYWRIYDKQFDKTFVFDPSNTTLQTDKNTNQYYLMADGPIGGLMDAIPADAKLRITLSQFLNVESADSILTVSLNDKYTITVDAFTGIECLQVKGNEGNGSWLMIRDEQQLEKLQELADIYKKKYPNLVKTDGVAMGFAQSEVEGFSVRTENGILSIACNGMEYMDDADPSKSWAVHYSGTDGNMYMEIMNAMAEGYIVGKDIEDYSAWEKYFEKKGLEFVKVLSDEEIEALENSLTAEQLAALTGEYPVSESDLPNPTAPETGVPERSASEYEEYKTAHYRFVPDNEAGCFDLYNEDGERIGVFDYADIKVRRDSATGRRYLISEHGSMSYDALPLDSELEQALRNVMGVDALETEELQGFTLKRHSDTGIRYLVRDGEEGRGGKVLLESEKDRQAYEALAQTYLNRYPNLIDSMEEAYIWADLEIKGLAQHTKDGFLSMGFDGMSYHDNADAKKNWSVMYLEDTYQAVTAWLQENKDSIRDIQEFATWQDVFENIGGRYERIWSKEEEKQGYLNN